MKLPESQKLNQNNLDAFIKAYLNLKEVIPNAYNGYIESAIKTLRRSLPIE